MTPKGLQIQGTLDGQTDLLDRQIVTRDGRLIAKVDDIELEEDGTALVVTGFLVGPGALGPRLGGALEYMTVNTWSRLARRDTDDPRRIDYSRVRGISTTIAVDEDRRRVEIDGLETWTRVRIIDALPGAGSVPQSGADHGQSRLEEGPGPRGRRHRFSHLAGMTVLFSDGTHAGQVTDVRLRRGALRGHLPELLVDGLIVGRNRPGTLFGYDRNRQQGPWVVQHILRWVHRHTGYSAWSHVETVDWSARVVQLACIDLRHIDGL